MQPRLTGTGDRVLQADRKNRMERARLDLQLRIYEREKLRKWGLVEREKKLILANLESIRRTTGFCEKGVAPSGSRDNIYEKSVHSRSLSRLSERRLMEWKVVERQLQRFLKAKAVSTDAIPMSNGLGKTIAWDDDKKKRKKKPGSARNRIGGEVEDEKLAVQQRVSYFLHHGRHSNGAGDSQKVPGTKIEEKLKRASSGKSVNSDYSSGRQRHHSEHLVRPHTALGQTSSPPKQSKRPSSAFTPTKQTGIIITKDAVYLANGATTCKHLLRSKSDVPSSKVNNFVRGLDSSSSIDSLPDRDVVYYERRHLEMRGYNRPGSSESEETLSEKSSKTLSKHVSMSSMLDQLNEEEDGGFEPVSQSTSRSTSAHSSKYSRVSSLSRSRSEHSLRQTDEYSNGTKLQEIDGEDCADSKPDETSEDDRRRRDIEYPDMHDANTVKDTLKTANVYSKRARKSALESLVEQNSPDKREKIRQERLRAMKDRSALLAAAAGQFNIKRQLQCDTYSDTSN